MTTDVSTQRAGQFAREHPTIEFLVAAARPYLRGGWSFTGFHWPVLAGQLAARLAGDAVVQVFEAGAVTRGPGARIPTSTTDFAAYGNALCAVGDTASTLLAMARRFDRVVLDAGNLDVAGRLNSSFIGSRDRPRVRLPGGGGAPDVAGASRELVLLHGGSDLRRLQSAVSNVTAAPGPQSTVELITRWGSVRLGRAPTLLETAEVEGVDRFVAHLEDLGVDCRVVPARRASSPTERRAAALVLREAAAQGYEVARRVLRDWEGDEHGDR